MGFARYISVMPRLLFNLVCTVLFVAIMGGIGYALHHQSLDFNEGFAIGGMTCVGLIWACHKLGIRVF